ncbi:MAG: acylphosphatase [Gemmatimonadales bacterium]
MIRRDYLIFGRVQGVGYRAFVLRTARGLGMAGFTRNRPDGTVEVAAVGPDSSHVRLGQALSAGPPHALVQRVDVVENSGEDAPANSFEIRT